MKPIKFFIALMLFCVDAMAQTPVINFDPISVSTFTTLTTSNYMGPADAPGNIYIAGSNRISKISPAGTVTVVAGNGIAGIVDGPAATAQFSGSIYLAIDAAGNIYVSDGGNNAVRKITPGGTVSTLAGPTNGAEGYQDGTGSAARFSGLRGIAADATGNVYVVESINYRVRKITAAGVVTTIAGDGNRSQILDPNDMGIDAAGNLYVTQTYGNFLKVTQAGVISTVFPPAFYGFKTGIAIDKSGNIYTTLTNLNGPTVSITVYKIFPGGDAFPLAGASFGYKDTIGAEARFANSIKNMTLDGQGNIYLLDGSLVRKMSKPALSFSGNAGAASAPKYFSISGNYVTGAASLQAPAGYELSLSEAGPYSTTLSVPPSAGEIHTRKIFIRLTASVLAGTYNGFVMLSSNGAVTQQLSVSGTVTNTPRKLVIIGSGTSACIGVGQASDCYVSRLSAYYNKLGPLDTTIDNSLARGSTNCYNGMPSSYSSPYPASSGYAPIKEINITAALALHPNAILVNYPTNGYDVLSVNEIMFCLRTIRDSANKQGVPCFITTTQPRTSPSPFNTSSMKRKLAVLKDSILAAFGTYAIDFWTGLTKADSSLLYDSGDQTNMNAAGHSILYQRVLAANVFSKPLPVVETGEGLRGNYFNGTFLPAFAVEGTVSRTDAAINVDLAAGVSPAPGFIDPTNYSVRWTGQVKAQFSQTYTFYTLTDKGVILTVNGVEIISDWANASGSASGPTERNATITLVAGQKYTIQLDYYHETGNSVAKLLWSGASTPKAIVPTSQLFLPLPPTTPPVPECTTNSAPANGSTIASSTTATLTWAPAGGATAYYVFFWTGATPPTLATYVTRSTSYEATFLTPSTTYKWYVIPYNDAFNASGCIAANTTSFTTAASATTGGGTGLQGMYYNGTAFAGTPLLTRVDPTINFELTYSHQPLSPAPGIVPDDNFSVRWTGQVQPLYSETYTFYTLSDDGIRLWVNGVQLVNNFVNQGATEKSGTITLVAGQKYDIIIEYFEGTGEAVAKLYWSSASTAKAIVPQSQLFPPGAGNPLPACAVNTSPANATTIASQSTVTLVWNAVATATSYDIYIWSGGSMPASPSANTTLTTYKATGLVGATTYNWVVVPKNAAGAATGCGTTNKTSFTTAAVATPTGGGTGLQGVYYNGIALAGTPLLTRIDPAINFKLDWDQQPIVLSPAPGIVPDDFYSVRWTGFVQPLFSETYTFYTNSDDGIRLWVNNVLLIDSWIDQNGSVQRSGSIALVAGQKYDIKIEFYEKASASLTKLWWSSTSTAKAIVPQSQLFPPSVSTRMMDNTANGKLSSENTSVFAITTASVSPNPVKRGQAARLQINSNRTGTAVVSVLGSHGTRISNQAINLVRGINTTSVNTSALAQGLYLISITGGNKPLTVKLLVE